MLSATQIKKIQSRVETSQSEIKLCETFRLLGDWNRYRIMKTLLEANELCVGDLSTIVGISMSATSQHLRLLEMSGLVTSERMGQMICYKPKIEELRVAAILDLLT